MKINLGALLGLLFTATSLSALTPDEWKYSQPLDLDAARPLKFSLPPATLDAARADVGDLRILGPDGQELPYLLLKPVAETGRTLAPKDFKAELSNSTTILTLATGTDQPLDSIALATGASRFLKAVDIELSADGQHWETLAQGVPIFRQDGATKTSLSLERRTAAYLRLTLDDERTRPIVVTAATLQTATDRPAPTEPLAPRLLRTEEFAGETVVTLDLGAAHLSLASLEISAEDPLFTRAISVAVRELRDGQIIERTLGQSAIYRIALEGLAPAANLTVPVNANLPGRELILHIANGDSPPLRLREISARRNPLYAVLSPLTSGRHQLLSGNPLVAAPRYDLTALSAELNRLPLTTARIGEPTTNSAYRQADPLADLALEGAALDTRAWKFRRPVTITAPGVQQIELDLPALAAAQSTLADLRLIQAGKQVPYILERTSLTRELTLTANSVPVPEHPSVSRWKITLPQPGMPFTRLSLTSPTRLFSRRIQVYETLTDSRGEHYSCNLASSDWTHKPEDKPQPLTLALFDRLQTDTLWLETDNADNPPITLERVQLFYPVIRLLCKTTSPELVELVYGNNDVAAPRYDADLVAAQLLTAEKHIAGLGSVLALDGGSGFSFLKGAHGGALFWAVLALVVILLLVVVAKLLPKPPAKP